MNTNEGSVSEEDVADSYLMSKVWAKEDALRTANSITDGKWQSAREVITRAEAYHGFILESLEQPVDALITCFVRYRTYLSALKQAHQIEFGPGGNSSTISVLNRAVVYLRFLEKE